jgi:hypothetical protein
MVLIEPFQPIVADGGVQRRQGAKDGIHVRPVSISLERAGSGACPDEKDGTSALKYKH